MINFSLIMSFALWAFQIKFYLMASTIALAYLLLYFFSPHKELSHRFYTQLSSALSIILISFVLYIYNTEHSGNPIYMLLQSIPIMAAPLLLAQMSSNNNKIPLGANSIANKWSNQLHDFRIIYTLILLISSGAMPSQNLLYYCASSLVIFLLSWALRRPTTIKQLIMNLALFFIITGSGFFLFKQIIVINDKFKDLAVEYLSDWVKDPFKTETSIGEIGRLKLNDRILFYVHSDNEPPLLMESNFDVQLDSKWVSSKRTFSKLNFKKPMANDVKSIEIYSQHKTLSVLPLPLGVEKIEGLENAILSISENNIIKAIGIEDHAHYTVFYRDFMESEISPFDYKVADDHKVWLNAVSQQIDRSSPEAIIKGVHQFFEKEGFTYSLDLGSQNNPTQALEDFMLQRKSGHCEYYAVATTLLLRHLGIPARLANGYSVNEFDPDQQLYIVRQRHAHAWSMAFINGKWVNIDNTPGTWKDQESAQASSLFSMARDFFAKILFYWRFKVDNDSFNFFSAIPYFSGFIAILLIIRFIKNMRSDSGSIKKQNNKFALASIVKLEKAFFNTQLALKEGETVEAWCHRAGFPMELSEAYYQIRFGAQSSPDLYHRLNTLVNVTIKKSKSALSQSMRDS